MIQNIQRAYYSRLIISNNKYPNVKIKPKHLRKTQKLNTK